MASFERKATPPRSRNGKSPPIFKAIQKFCSKPLAWFIMLGIGVFFYFFGWVVLVWVTTAAAIAACFYYVYSIFRSNQIKKRSAMLKINDPGQTQGFEGLDRSGKRCLACREKVLRIAPGKTSAVEIAKFASRSQVWSENSEALNGWMHPGIYCPNGCVTIFIDYPMTAQQIETGIFDICLLDPGRNRRNVFSYLRHVLDMSLEHLKNRRNSSPTVIATGRHNEVDRIYNELKQLGARVDIAKKKRAHRRDLEKKQSKVIGLSPPPESYHLRGFYSFESGSIHRKWLLECVWH